jgi:hypothetical protein
MATCGDVPGASSAISSTLHAGHSRSSSEIGRTHVRCQKKRTGVDVDEGEELRAANALSKDSSRGVAARAAVTDDDDARAIELRGLAERGLGGVEEIVEIEARPHDGRAGRVTRVSWRSEDEGGNLPRSDERLEHGAEVAVGRTEPRVDDLVGIHSVEEHDDGQRCAARRAGGHIGEPTVRVAGVEKAPLPVRKDDGRAARRIGGTS